MVGLAGLPGRFGPGNDSGVGAVPLSLRAKRGNLVGEENPATNRDCHVALLLAMTAYGGGIAGLVWRCAGGGATA